MIAHPVKYAVDPGVTLRPILWARQGLILLFALFGEAWAGTDVLRGPAPGWVDALPVPAKSSSSEAPGGVRFLLVDAQRNEAEQTAYQHRAIEMVTAAGVQENSRITIGFVPEYQTLTLHSLILHRDGEALDRLAGARIRVIDREDGISGHVYTGAVMAAIDVEDVRPGDVLEYSSSLHGENPVFAGVLSEFLATAWAVPVARFQFRLLCPQGLQFRAFLKGAEARHEEIATGGLIDHRWIREDLPPLVFEDGTPDWYNPSAWLQLSAYASWGHVVEWGLQFYGKEEALPPPILAEVGRLRSLASSDDRILGALEYVQTKLRYLSASEGVHSHRPYPVAEVVGRGYGDCKDKARLLSAMLRALGVEASPALVATEHRHQIADWLPTPQAFDHVIVAVQLPTGMMWLDPTADFQGGPLRSRYVPAYGKALIIRSGEMELRDVQTAGWEETRLENEVNFHLGEGDAVTRLTIATTRSGEQADAYRAMLALVDRTEIAKGRINEISRWFPGTQATHPPKYEDDETLNRLVRRETFEIPKFWEDRESDPYNVNADILPWIIRDRILAPETTVRTTPLGIDHPVRIHETYRVHFPVAGEFESGEWSVNDPVFRYRCAVQSQGAVLTIEHWFETLTDFVPPEKVPAYLENLRKVREGAIYGMRLPKVVPPGQEPAVVPAPQNLAAPDVPHIMVPFVALCALVIALFVGVLYILWRPDWIIHSDPYYNGLGGWLILIGFSLVTGTLAWLGVFASNLPFFDPNRWADWAAPGGALYHPICAWVILAEISYNMVLLVTSVVLLVLFFKKRRTFPLLYIIAVAGIGIFEVADTIAVDYLSRVVPEFPKPDYIIAAGAVFRMLIWIPYMLMSRRVRSTFIRGGPPPRSQ